MTADPAPALASPESSGRPLAPAGPATADAKWLARVCDAAEEMRLDYNRALEKHGNTNPVLRDLRHAIGHLAVTREAALAPREADDD
jgi:hypothetical protein